MKRTGITRTPFLWYTVIVCLSMALMLNGCVGNYLNTKDVVVPGAAAATGVAAYYIADKEGCDSTESAAWAGGTALATYVVGMILANKADKDKIAAYGTGFTDGRAFGARRQYEIIQELQKSSYNHRRMTVYELPGPAVKDGEKKVPYTVKLEVVE